jgi:uncharacterized protein YjbI with pentapeptide repeats
VKALPPLLALGLFALLATVASPAAVLAQTAPATGCVRRHVPDPSTLQMMTQAYVSSTINTISPADFQSVPAGADIPEMYQHGGGFQMAMWGISAPNAAQCTALGLSQGALIQASGGPDIDILASATPPPPWCVRRHVPDLPTLHAITGTYPQATWGSISATGFSNMSFGEAIPESSQSQYQQAISLIYDQGAVGTTCAQGGLTIGQLITSAPEIDVVAPADWSPGIAYCERQATPPAPPDGGAVLAIPFDPNSGEPNVVVFPLNSYWVLGMCGSVITNHPATIAVAAPQFQSTKNAALYFQDRPHNLTSAWGAVNVAAGSPAPVLYPGRPDFAPFFVRVYAGRDLGDNNSLNEYFRAFASCRSCDLTSYGQQWGQDSNDGVVPSQPEPTEAYAFDLSYAHLNNVELRGQASGEVQPISFANWNLSHATVASASDLGGLIFSGANLSNAVVVDTPLDYANLQGANLSGAILTGSSMTHANLSGANLSGSHPAQVDFTSANLSGANLSGAGFYGTTVTSANLTSADLSGIDFTQFTTGLSSATLTGVNLSSSNLTGWDLSNVDLSGAKFLNATLTNAKLVSANLSGADLSGTDLTLTPLVAANLSGANLSGVNLNLTQLAGADLSGANLSGANLSGTTLTSAKLQALNPTSATPTPLIVDGTQFDKADLRGAQLGGFQFNTPPTFNDITVGVDDSGACTAFQNVDLRASNLTLEPVLPGCETSPLLPGSTVPLDLASGWIQQEVDVNLTSARFAVDAANRSSLSKQNMQGINLSGVAFVGWPVDLTGANLSSANLANARLPGAVLTGALLQNVKASGASFRGATLAGTAAAQCQSTSTDQGACFSGSNTDLTNADFAGADMSFASFSSANLGGASFEGALADSPDFNGVRAVNARFTGAHIQDDSSKAFDNANDLSGTDFTGAVLVGDRSVGGGFNLTKTNLQGAHFEYVQCIGCNFASSDLDDVTFSYAYLMGAVFSNATMQGADMTNTWLHCADSGNSQCQKSQDSPPMWSWPLVLGQNDLSGDISFTTTDFTGVSGQLPRYCPDGTSDWTPDADQINNTTTPPTVSGVCTGHLQPNAAWSFPVCSAAGSDPCPTATAQLFDTSVLPGKLLSLAPLAPPVWSTTLPDSSGYAIGMDDHTVRVVGGSDPHILAGSSRRACAEATQACGDGGSASQALLGNPAGLAVGLDGSVYIADSAMHRVRRIDPSGFITTIAGSGQACATARPGASDCGNGGAATVAQLLGPYGVYVDPMANLVIADGAAGLRQVGSDGTLSLVAGTNAYNLQSVVGDAAGYLFAAAHNPDYLIQVNSSGTVSIAVGTGTSGYNGNTDSSGYILLDGNQVQISDPDGLSVDGNGNILFADTGNNMVRGYVPQSQHLMDPLGGCVTYANANDQIGEPQGGNNGVGQWSDQIELSGPVGLTTASGALLVVADAGNQQLVLLGPSPDPTAPPACTSSASAASLDEESVSLASVQLSPTPTASAKLTPSATPTAVATHTPAATQTPATTQTPVATKTPLATRTPVATHTPVATQSPVATQTPTPAAVRTAPTATPAAKH